MFFPVGLTKFLGAPFLQNTSARDFFWIGLMVKKFNSVPLIFVNEENITKF